MKNAIVRFLKDENGQTSTEYILLVAVVFLLVLKFKNTATQRLDAVIKSVFDGADTLTNQINNEIN